MGISAYDIDNDCCDFKYLDYGGYDSVEASELLQVRQDFLNLPFQAVECYLSNVIPPSDCSEWPMESLQFLLNSSVIKIFLAVKLEVLKTPLHLFNCTYQ